MKKIVLVGAGGHCKVIIDIIKSIEEFEIVGITDKSNICGNLLGIPIIGDDEVLQDLFNKGVEYAFVSLGSIDNLAFRYELYKKLKQIGFKVPTLIHKNSIVSPYASIEEGVCIMANAVVNANAYVGKNSIINTSSIIEHDCIIGDNCHISPGAKLGGNCKIGNNVHIGIGATVIHSINIGENTTIGAGAVVIDNIGDNKVAVGVPAKIIKTKV
ncbi:acetyltransferase [Caloramator sp. E03]|uniref:acetyltransferase n=1 Tax=Caloramator sp. E03 TaxID=2576307 RepID=UPI0011100AEC|nr:acetyltransferase [Caloramator sp. E03]QCX32362.1 acetyltransferase [Caloramator sp. E03]